ncbi:uncharacterized protein L969DRAFT_18623 [Mixia osmundae IAM 14324]|uniref:UBX domain-containing protein n=1 Tax=Mixia osmundae (strain CBS 9802 / IAM 14324 / JCM 22182 / KY 12970) TaxID=764103 RepID=G7EAA4_MIXOS|nr:uncharacterized protein L969DRAFT_18623 [Mixia osmundae IAM 14324]KEI37823.1 hypothetical protein L969DRAFT_18623 [Mixia osmundae IAM 14324]GAA99764.1 hypothetical protein E5Q_06467 [Mixia osmundae IAM 14324]
MADQESIATFVELTQASPEVAQQFLASSNGDLETALGTFFAAQGGEEDDMETPEADLVAPQTAAAPHTLSGGSAAGPWPSSAAANPRPSASSAASGPRITGLGDMGSARSSKPAPGIKRTGQLGRISHDDGPSSDEDEEDAPTGKKKQEFFAGGEKSGISVQQPGKPGGMGPAADNRLVQDILKKAEEASPSSPAGPSGSRPPAGPSSFFRGQGNTLGSEEVPSQPVGTPLASSSRHPPSTRGTLPGALGGSFGEEEDDDELNEDDDGADEPARRILTFWRDGFSIEDGPLLRYDDKANKEYLDALNSGRAPLDLLNVRFGQRVDLQVSKRLDEDYKPPPKQAARPFEGSGNRLGSPAPGAMSSQPSASAASADRTARTVPQPVFEVDSSQPTTQIQIRSGSGDRLVARFNHTHTVGDIRRYLEASSPGAGDRPYVLQTTFPNRDLDDDSATIGDSKLLGSVVVQRYR